VKDKVIVCLLESLVQQRKVQAAVMTQIHTLLEAAAEQLVSPPSHDHLKIKKWRGF
jgi:hypothetical protein